MLPAVMELGGKSAVMYFGIDIRPIKELSRKLRYPVYAHMRMLTSSEPSELSLPTRLKS